MIVEIGVNFVPVGGSEQDVVCRVLVLRATCNRQHSKEGENKDFAD